jgi:sulfide:quinone oxidoreductase
VGSNFGGLAAALAVKHELHGDVDVTAVSAADRFLFNPSLIWLPFGKRTPEDFTFPVEPTLSEHDIEFVHAPATRIDTVAQTVDTSAGSYPYDYPGHCHGLPQQL